MRLGQRIVSCAIKYFHFNIKMFHSSATLSLMHRGMDDYPLVARRAVHKGQGRQVGFWA